MTDPNIFNQFLIWPFINLLILFYKAFALLHIPGAFGWAIVGLTLAIRLALRPMTKKQLESAQKMQLLKPHLDELNKKHKNDKRRFQEEQMKLYREHGINPAAGCLPLIISFPILIALYRVFFQVLNTGNMQEVVDQINHIVYFSALHISSIDLSFFGIDLAAKPSQWQSAGWWLLLIPVITGVLQWFQMKAMTPAQPVQKKSDKKDKKQDDFASEMQKQMQFIFPVMIGFAAYSFPFGLSLYWNTFSIMSIFDRPNRTSSQTPKS